MKKRLGRFIGSDHMPVREKRKSVAETRGKHESVFERVSVNNVLNWICIAKFYSSH